ncbi:MAG: hypothetical protein NTW10_10350 [Bacteroidetes bacterium]|nr:hypothetical protein [Bacteroidota bacterium]
MKTLAKIAMIVLMSTGAWMMPQRAAAQFPGISFQVFYDQLSPYGAWIYDDSYGYVWIPDESAGFYPYGTNGHWVLTNFGWTWVSNYPWGWAPFHYGRWNYDNYYGWIWVPGNEWGPAWVTWRRCNDYYGWAPLGPGMTILMSFNINFFMPDDRWMFVRNRDFDRNDLDRYYIGRRENHDLVVQSRNIENTRVDNSTKVTWGTGPDAKEVRKVTGRSIKPMPVEDNTKPGKTIVDKGKVQIYKPPVYREDVSAPQPVPVKIAARETIKPASERMKGDLTRTSISTNQKTGSEKTQPPAHTLPPKYERNDQVNQNSNSSKVNQVDPGSAGKTQSQGTVSGQKNEESSTKVEPSGQPRPQQPPVETRNREQSNQKQNVQPPVETRKQQPPAETKKQPPSGQKQTGAPAPKPQPNAQPSKTNSTHSTQGKTDEVKKSTTTAPANNEKSEPGKRGH